MPAHLTLHTARLAIIAITGIFTLVTGEPMAQKPKPSHHTPDGFANVYDHSTHGLGKAFKWKFGFGPAEDSPLDTGRYVPISVPPDLAAIKSPDTATIQCTWIGHSTFLIQVEGKNILTDPIWSERASPVTFAGPKRHSPLPFPLTDLPPIDYVVISHSHYDHLDSRTIHALGNKPHYFVPLKLRQWFIDAGITNVTELDWWDSATASPLVFRAVPAQHFSGRSAFKFNATLWCGWTIESKHGTVYFAGDAGYAPHFKEIAAQVPAIKVALLPIGAYRPRWFMRPSHVDPADAVQCYLDLKAENALAMHWGTFILSDEPIGEPPLLLKKALVDRGIPADKFRSLQFGQTVRF